VQRRSAQIAPLLCSVGHPTSASPPARPAGDASARRAGRSWQSHSITPCRGCCLSEERKRGWIRERRRAAISRGSSFPKKGAQAARPGQSTWASLDRDPPRLPVAAPLLCGQGTSSCVPRDRCWPHDLPQWASSTRAGELAGSLSWQVLLCRMTQGRLKPRDLQAQLKMVPGQHTAEKQEVTSENKISFA